MLRHPLLSASLVLSAALACTAAGAGELYGNLGFPGVGLGYAHPVSEQLTLRGDFMTLGSRHKDQTEDGIDYTGKLKAQRLGVFADWFVFSGRFRLTGGVASTTYKLELDASGAGRTLNVGNTNYTLTAADGLNVQVKYPGTMPYLGLGWGHQIDSGLRLSFDVGALFGKAKVDVSGRGPQLGSAAAQQDIDRETQQLRDDLGKLRFIPQLTLGLGYSF
jgi:hypothetical protein